MLDPATTDALAEAAERFGIESAVLMAVIEVESNGKAFELVMGHPEPLIRWEGHYFDRLVPPLMQYRAREMGLASSKMGGIANSRNQAGRYEMLRRGKSLDVAAAISSCSWGVGQVMGSHWQWLGYESAVAFMERVRGGLLGQVEVMLRYIERAGLIDELQRLDWKGFARGYNGPKFAKFKYDTKLAAAYARHAGGRAAFIHDPLAGMLKMGMKGNRVRDLQAILARAGYNVKVDGDFGPATRAAVKSFQTTNALKVDGVVGPATLTAISRFRVDPEEELGKQAISEISEVKTGLATGGAGIAITVAVDKLEALAEKVAAFPTFPYADLLGAGLYTAAGIMVIGGVAYTAWGWFKSRRSDAS